MSSILVSVTHGRKWPILAFKLCKMVHNGSHQLAMACAHAPFGGCTGLHRLVLAHIGRLINDDSHRFSATDECAKFLNRKLCAACSTMIWKLVLKFSDLEKRVRASAMGARRSQSKSEQFSEPESHRE